MENLLGGLIAPKSSKLVGSGQNPTSIGTMGNPMERIHAKFELPTEISPKEVIRQTEELGRMDAEGALARQIIKNQKVLLKKSVDLYDMNTQWSSEKMQAEQRLREIQSKHGIEVAQHQLGTATTQAYNSGYTTAFQMSAEIFD